MIGLFTIDGGNVKITVSINDKPKVATFAYGDVAELAGNDWDALSLLAQTDFDPDLYDDGESYHKAMKAYLSAYRPVLDAAHRFITGVTV